MFVAPKVGAVALLETFVLPNVDVVVLLEILVLPNVDAVVVCAPNNGVALLPKTPGTALKPSPEGLFCSKILLVPPKLDVEVTEPVLENKLPLVPVPGKESVLAAEPNIGVEVVLAITEGDRSSNGC